MTISSHNNIIILLETYFKLWYCIIHNRKKIVVILDVESNVSIFDSSTRFVNFSSVAEFFLIRIIIVDRILGILLQIEQNSVGGKSSVILNIQSEILKIFF